MAFQQDDDDEDQTQDAPETSDDAKGASDGPSDDEEDLGEAAKADQQSSAAPQQSPDDRSAAIRAYLQSQYGDAADTSDLDTARAQEKAGVQHANLMHHMSGLFMAGSQAAGGPGASEADYQTALKQAHMPVQQAEEDRSNAIKDFLTGQQLGRQSDSDLQKQKEWQVQNDTNDPTSKKSQMAVHLFESQFPDALKGWTDDEKGQLSANDVLKLAMPGQEKVAQLAATREMARARIAQQGQVRQFQQDQKDRTFAHNDLKDLGHDLDSETASGRSGLGVAQQKVDSANRLLTFADVNPNSPEDLATLRAAKTDPKARAALVQKMNNLTPQQYTEIVSGLMAQINPGGGSLGQLEHLRADTASQTKANLLQYFTAHPSGAGVGEMIVNNLGTLANERDTSQAVLDKHAAKMRAKHPMAFQHPETSDQAEAMVKGFSQPPAPEPTPSTPPPAAVHPQADAAVAWAKGHPDDPRSAEILKRVGAMNAGL